MTLGGAHAGGACDRPPSHAAWKHPFNRLELLKRLRLTTDSAVLRRTQFVDKCTEHIDI